MAVELEEVHSEEVSRDIFWIIERATNTPYLIKRDGPNVAVLENLIFYDSRFVTREKLEQEFVVAKVKSVLEP